MRIDSIEVWKESFSLSRPYTIAFRTISHVDNMIVKLGCRGKIGLGAASPEPFVTGEHLEDTEAALEKDRLNFLKECDFEPALQRLGNDFADTPAARAAVEIALYDLKAQLAGKPLVELWGRKHRELPTSITIGIKNVDDTLTEAREYLGRGFNVLKVKLGKDIEEDLERVHKLRALVGKGVKLRLDMNQGYSSTQLRRFWDETQSADIEFVEQPLPAKDVDALRNLPPEIRSRIAADESLLSPHDAKRLVTPEPACGIFNIKLMKCGGPTQALAIAETAEKHQLRLMWGCMDESRISIAAALHTAFSCAATRYLDLDGSLDLGRDLVEGGFNLEKGIMTITEASGLGVTLLG